MAFKLPNIANWTTPFGARTDEGYAAAAVGAAGNVLGGLAPATASGFTGFAQGLVGLGGAYANNYGAYASGLGNVAQAQANNESNKYGSRAMAEAARQSALGNIGSAALGAYGSAANSAMSAWAQNQMAYNKSLSEMQQANQQSMSNYGVSRNQALAGLAGAYGDAGGRLGAASAVGDVSATFGDGGFNASGFNASGSSSPIASGSYGSPGGGFYGSITRTGNNSGVPDIASQTFGGLDRTRDSLMAGDITAALTRDADLGRMQLDDQHYSSRDMPSQMMDQALGGLLTMSRDGYGSSGLGMNQFYDSLERAESADRMSTPDYSTLLGGLSSGFLHSGDQITGLRGDLGQGYQDFREDIGGMFRYDPAADVRKEREAEMLRRQYQGQDAQQLLAEYAGREHAIPHDIASAAGLRWDSGGTRYYDPRDLGYTATEPPPAPSSPRPINPRGDTDPRVAHLFTPTPTRADHRDRYRSTIWR